MKSTFKIIFGCLIACGLLSATPPACITGTLTSYIALGPQGCTIGTVVYANFTYSIVSPSIAANQITVMPTFVAPTTGRLTFSGPWNVPKDQMQEADISYTAALPAGSSLPSALQLILGTAQIKGVIGNVTIDEQTNLPGASTGGDETLSVFDRCTEVCQTKALDNFNFNSTNISVLILSNHLSLSGGTGGVTLDQFTNSLTLCTVCP